MFATMRLVTSRRVASQFTPSTLPRIVRPYSSSTAYEHIIVSTPKPGVGLGKLWQSQASRFNCSFLLIVELPQSLLTGRKPSMPSAHPSSSSSTEP
jgi:hypothetical protein